jgi:hypothetical protein
LPLPHIFGKTLISALDAVQQKLITIKAKGKGGYNGKVLNVEIKHWKKHFTSTT